MNRFELFLALVLFFGLAVYTLRTRWFDRFIDWVTGAKKNAPKSTENKPE